MYIFSLLLPVGLAATSNQAAVRFVASLLPEVSSNRDSLSRLSFKLCPSRLDAISDVDATASLRYTMNLASEF
jgi:hypothetical protein